MDAMANDLTPERLAEIRARYSPTARGFATPIQHESMRLRKLGASAEKDMPIICDHIDALTAELAETEKDLTAMSKTADAYVKIIDELQAEIDALTAPVEGDPAKAVAIELEGCHLGAGSIAGLIDKAYAPMIAGLRAQVASAQRAASWANDCLAEAINELDDAKIVANEALDDQTQRISALLDSERDAAYRKGVEAAELAAVKIVCACGEKPCVCPWGVDIHNAIRALFDKEVTNA